MKKERSKKKIDELERNEINQRETGPKMKLKAFNHSILVKLCFAICVFQQQL